MIIRQYDHLYKTVIIGNSGVGKSSLLVRFVENQFSQHYLATIGVDFRFKTLRIDEHNIKFQIWDTAGQERFRTITSAYYRGSQGILLVFDLTDEQSFDNICKFWMNEVEMYSQKDALYFLIGNKCDLENEKVVSNQKITQFCKLKNLNYVQCSAKQNIKIQQIFIQMAKKLMLRTNKIPISCEKRGQGLNNKKNKKSCC